MINSNKQVHQIHFRFVYEFDHQMLEKFNNFSKYKIKKPI